MQDSYENSGPKAPTTYRTQYHRHHCTIFSPFAYGVSVFAQRSVDGQTVNLNVPAALHDPGQLFREHTDAGKSFCVTMIARLFLVASSVVGLWEGALATGL